MSAVNAVLLAIMALPSPGLYSEGRPFRGISYMDRKPALDQLLTDRLKAFKSFDLDSIERAAEVIENADWAPDKKATNEARERILNLLPANSRFRATAGQTQYAFFLNLKNRVAMLNRVLFDCDTWERPVAGYFHAWAATSFENGKVNRRYPLKFENGLWGFGKGVKGWGGSGSTEGVLAEFRYYRATFKRTWK